ncbi:MAG: phage tail protein [Massilia sp.]|jgi:microcystin-dependent protein|nr:phage tail protein [Massilia sp.]
MTQQYLGEIRIFGGNFPPRDWALCDGAVLPIAQYDALFSLLGTTYGGDGQSTFALPDLRGRVPIHQGTGPGLPNYPLGMLGGVEAVTLTAQQLPVHSHDVGASTAAPSAAPGGLDITAGAPYVPGSFPSKPNAYGNPGSTVAMNAQAITAAGASIAHDNMAPFLGINFIIALFGIYPSQN